MIDDSVDAVFGDVEGYPIASDIFSNIKITENGKAIHFSGGSIPPGGRFTDLHYADSDQIPEIVAFDYAAIDSWFSGVLVPEPSTTLLAWAGLAGLLAFRKPL